jgi:membrane-bound metal-dependent hydrolase YbcI (DUF457 family)
MRKGMADGKTHEIAGVVAGGSWALYQARDQEFIGLLFEGIGGAIGGYVGGKLPDLLEPAIHSYHRDFCHSLTTGVALSAGTISAMEKWAKFCRDNAEDCRIRRTESVDGCSGFIYGFGEVVWRMLAGLLVGLVGGYISHLVFDAVTPRSIPLISKSLV